MSDERAPKGHVTVGILLGGPTPHFVRSFAEMVMFDRELGRGHLHPSRPFITSTGQAFVTNGRNETVRQFLNSPDPTPSDWLLFLDDDQVYPQNLLEVLIESADPVERQIVGVPVWRFAGMDKATGLAGVDHNVFDADPETMTFRPSGELPENVVTDVAAIGTGCMMIHRSALLKIAAFARENGMFDGTCWFRQTHHDPGPYVEGEDLHFCRLAWAAGVPVWANTSITLEHQKQVRLTKALPFGSVAV